MANVVTHPLINLAEEKLLAAAKISTVSKLYETQNAILVEMLGFSSSKVKLLKNQAEMMLKIKSLAGGYIAAMNKVGIESIADLAKADPKTVREDIHSSKFSGGASLRKLPSEKAIASWAKQASEAIVE